MPLTDPSNQGTRQDQLTQSQTVQSTYDLEKIKEGNRKSVDLIFDEKGDKTEEALEILKKIEVFLEANAIEPKTIIDKKILIIILHNLACCYQKLKDFDNCISYLEAVIYHFDSTLEPKHKIKINEEYFLKIINKDQSTYSLLGDFILELRFSAKFHLQMCAVLSQASRHTEALQHAKLAALMCEDNLVKTYYLYNQMINKENKYQNMQNKSDENYALFAEKIQQSHKIIKDLYLRVLSIRNKSKGKNTNFYDSYLNYRNSEILKYSANLSLVSNIRNVFGNTIKKDDWIQLLNIGNIMYLSALNYEDLDLDSDPKYELLRDAILEKVVMLTVAYFCIASELRFLSTDKQNPKTNGEFYHYKAVEFASLFLPVSCPIVKHYIMSYYKHYGNDMKVVPEGEVCTEKIELLRSEIEQDKDIMTFVTSKPLGYTNAVLLGSKINQNGISQSTNIDNNGHIIVNRENKEYDLLNNNYLASRTKIKEDKAPKFKLNFMNLNNMNNGISNNNHNSNSSNIKDDSANNMNHFNRSNNSNSNSNNNSERNFGQNKAKTDRIKISKMHISKNNKQVGQSKTTASTKKGSITDRIHSSNRKVSINNVSKDKCKTQRDFHSSETMVKYNGRGSSTKLKNYASKSIKYKKTSNPSKYIVKIKSGAVTNNSRKENSRSLIDKLLSQNKKSKTENNSYNSSSASSINSLIKVLKPKKK